MRSAYAQVSTEALLGNTGVTVTVKLKQKQAGWQSADPVNIGGIVHSNGGGDTENWKGDAEPGGSCVVSYDKTHGVVLTWSSYPFNTAYTKFFDDMLYAADFWNNGTLSNNALFEFDSLCPNSTYLPQIKAKLGEQTNSLLQQKNCTWAFWGFKKETKEEQDKNSYLFWTSLDASKVGAGEKIPVLILTGDGSYYVSETTTEQREKNREPYVTVSKRLYHKWQFEDILKAGEKYSTLEEAYDAYVVALAKDEYKGVRDSQTSAP